MEPFSAAKLLQEGIDGSSVNWPFYDKLNNERNELKLPELWHTGSCGLHILHGPFKACANATEWNWPRFSQVFINCLMIHRQGGQIILS